MSIAVFISSEMDAASLIPWGVRFAEAFHSELLVVAPRKSKGKRAWDPLEIDEGCDNPLFEKIFEVIEQQDAEKVVLKQLVASGDESTDHDRVLIETRELIAPVPEEAFVEEAQQMNIKMLLLPAVEHSKSDREQDTWSHQLFLHAPCEVVVVRGAPPAKETKDSKIDVLVASRGGNDTDVALQRGLQLVKSSDGTLTFLFVRPDDDEVARAVAQRHIDRLVFRALGRDVTINQKIELAPSLMEGIKRQSLEQYDLILLGARSEKKLKQFFRGLVSTEKEPVTAALATIRESVPLTSRLWGKIQTKVREKVPQLDRDMRVSLVDRLQNNSKFDFDFVALISLSTLIAALGLIRDSASVVIGAMLVAPLMTPLVGIGFALIQGNFKLTKDAIRSVVLGFAVAFGIGVLVGVVVHHFPVYCLPDFITGNYEGIVVNNEMEGRHHPNLLDLIVALASGVAGAYAMSRPNLLGALPGVAIAAALVPPIAVSGMAFAMGEWDLSGGSLLLFLTNIVAIVLGTAITFWGVGINDTMAAKKDETQPKWPRLAFIAFVIISFVLAAIMTVRNAWNVPEIKPNIPADIETLTDNHDIRILGFKVWD